MSNRDKVSIESILEGLPLVITTQQLADALGVSQSTIYEWRSKGRFDGCFRKRGKHLLFVTKKTINHIFNGPEWKE